jgi:hypothetical protein
VCENPYKSPEYVDESESWVVWISDKWEDFQYSFAGQVVCLLLFTATIDAPLIFGLGWMLGFSWPMILGAWAFCSIGTTIFYVVMFLILIGGLF